MNKFHLGLGDRAPNFSLPGVDHRTYSLDGLADKAVIVIVFSCNHCPYVQAYEDRLVAIQRDYAARGVQVVAINSNDDVHYPEDSLENMVTRAKAKGFNFPYLRDASQAVARAYGATHTPQLFVFDQQRYLRYALIGFAGWPSATFSESTLKSSAITPSTVTSTAFIRREH